ncbi:MAG: hypothetical protein GF347_00110 [Candidatus Moranbacteria bacterium]|nr:hypothetical protein [Candidatus Moranbacteria bacterium]
MKINRLNNFLLKLIFLLLPFQYRFFFHTDYSNYKNHVIEYNLLFFSSIELLIILLILFNSSILFQFLARKIKNRKFLVLIFSFLLILNIFFAESSLLAVHKYLHLSIWVLFFCLSKFLIKNPVKLIVFLKYTFFSACVASITALLQFAFQSSIGLKYLGESLIAPDILGVAKIAFNNQKIIRGYGTFPHPNILGAFLLIMVFSSTLYLKYLKENTLLLFGSYKYRTKSIIKRCKNFIRHRKTAFRLPRENIYNNHNKKIEILIFKIIQIILILGIFVTFSRISILALFLLALSSLIFLKSRYLFLICLIISAIFFVSFKELALSRIGEENSINNDLVQNVSYRNLYSAMARRTIAENFYFGVGAGNYILYQMENNISQALPWEIQPVHNTLLYLIAEMGILLAGFLIYFLIYALIKNFNQNKLYLKYYYVFILILLIPFSFDHYFYSFPQGFALIYLLLIQFYFYKKI